MADQRAHLRVCTVVSAEGERAQAYVRCPLRETTIDAGACTGCARMRSFDWDPAGMGEVICDVDVERAPMDRRADLGEAAARAALHELVAPTTTCFASDLTVARMKILFEEKALRAAPVVDAEGKLQGVVSRASLMTAPGDATAADVMTASLHTLPEDAPVSFAIALIALEEIDEVPVVTAEGAVIGICHARDVLRWVARRLGYSVPARDGTKEDGAVAGVPS